MAGMSRDGPKQHPASLGGAGGQRGAGSLAAGPSLFDGHATVTRDQTPQPPVREKCM
jgi:hypothetical protein